MGKICDPKQKSLQFSYFLPCNNFFISGFVVNVLSDFPSCATIHGSDPYFNNFSTIKASPAATA